MDVQVEISEAAVLAMYCDTDPYGPIGRIIQAATERVGDYQQLTAPVSPVGSKYAPPGFLRSATGAAQELHTDPATGFVIGYAGTRTNRHGGGFPYPLAFISNPAGRTRNRGGKSWRAAVNRYIQRALNSLESFVYGAP